MPHPRELCTRDFACQTIKYPSRLCIKYYFPRISRINRISRTVSREVSRKYSEKLGTETRRASDICSYNNISLSFRGRVAGLRFKAPVLANHLQTTRYSAVDGTRAQKLPQTVLSRASAHAGSRSVGSLPSVISEFLLHVRIHDSMFIDRQSPSLPFVVVPRIAFGYDQKQSNENCGEYYSFFFFNDRIARFYSTKKISRNRAAIGAPVPRCKIAFGRRISSRFVERTARAVIYLTRSISRHSINRSARKRKKIAGFGYAFRATTDRIV